MRARWIYIPLLIASFAMPVVAATSEPKIPVDQIIQSFIDKETEFAKAREAYTYRQSVKVIEMGNDDRERGRFEVVQDIIFGPNKERTERVVYAPVSTLQGLLLTPNDMQDLRDVQPFVMTRDNAHEYQIDYLGEQTVDELETYMFSVKPKKIVKGTRYFEGQVWVDQQDLQIVKTYGKGVGHRKKNDDEQFPRFETYRDQIDGKYWFPIYTSANDTLQFKSGAIKMKMIIKYEDYKRFGGESTITFGETLDGEPVEVDPQLGDPTVVEPAQDSNEQKPRSVRPGTEPRP